MNPSHRRANILKSHAREMTTSSCRYWWTAQSPFLQKNLSVIRSTPPSTSSEDYLPKRYSIPKFPRPRQRDKSPLGYSQSSEGLLLGTACRRNCPNQTSPTR